MLYICSAAILHYLKFKIILKYSQVFYKRKQDDAKK